MNSNCDVFAGHFGEGSVEDLTNHGPEFGLPCSFVSFVICGMSLGLEMSGMMAAAIYPRPSADGSASFYRLEFVPFVISVDH